MTSPTDFLTIRLATDDDLPALESLAALDSQHLPRRPLMAALTGEDFVAAMSLADGRWIADPFAVSEPAVRVLRRRVADINGHDVPRRGLRAPSVLTGLFNAVPRGV